jgi:hypothetical protein
VLTTKSNDYEINEKLESNSSQWSVSRPSNILKQLWSSASKSINSTNDNNILKLRDFNENNTNSFKNFKFGPIKWSSEIVPSVPLELQIPKDAIFSQHFLIKSKNFYSNSTFLNTLKQETNLKYQKLIARNFNLNEVKKLFLRL